MMPLRVKDAFFLAMGILFIAVPNVSDAEAPLRSAARVGSCSGVLHKNQFGLHFGGERGEGEGICVVQGADAGRVLAICRVGHYCKITGTIQDCTDSGECSEITQITSVKSAR